ncbi:MAG: A/G-specific adenine glycosylase [Gammaproteobacteria bacterium]|nr:A/G-specific adenine glycosylase [Gammaproteobacteria bacterium]
MFNWFQDTLLAWFKTHGRHDLPWQNHSPYYTWLSEIMLQQTQVATVIPYFKKFTDHYPDIITLANASVDEVFQLWAGLGYYHRAKNLLATAKIIATEYQGQFPNDMKALQALPGIGPSTAAAIASLAFNQAHAIFDGNVKRVLARFFGVEGPINDKHIINNLFFLAQECMPNTNCSDYTQAIMDMGATCCKPKNPLCHNCPLHLKCMSFQEHKTAIIPGKAIRKKAQDIRYDFVVYYNQAGEIYLEQRTAEGIWPHLWCFPSIEQSSDGKRQIKHQLTHQRMEIHLHYLQNPALTGPWFNQANIDNLALPKALSRMTKVIFQDVKSALH